MTCEFCRSNVPRFKDGLECCELRKIARLPNDFLWHHRCKLTDEEWQALKPKLIEERRRLKAIPVIRKRSLQEKAMEEIKNILGETSDQIKKA